MITREEAIRRITTKHCTSGGEDCEYCERVREVVTLIYDEFFAVLCKEVRAC